MAELKQEDFPSLGGATAIPQAINNNNTPKSYLASLLQNDSEFQIVKRKGKAPEKNSEVDCTESAEPVLAIPKIQNSKKIVILDSGPIIAGCLMNFIQNYEEWEFYTVSEVVNEEVKDKKAKEMLSSFPVPIKQREPSSEAIKAISDFSRKTGDFYSLSKVDLKLLALTYDFEVELNGKSHIKTTPEIKEMTTNNPIGVDTFFHSQPKEVEANSEESQNETSKQDQQNFDETSKQGQAENDDMDDDEGWINPENIEEKTIEMYGGFSGDKAATESGAGLITTDFAMQNVLLLMGLRPLSISGFALKSVKQWILKCFTCYEITKQNNKLFCPKCGAHPLIKVAVQVDNSGQVVYRNPPDRFFSTRGTIFNVPPKKGGRSKKDVVFSEDEYILAKRAHRFDPTYKVSVGYKQNPNIPKKKIGKKNKPFRN